MVSSMTKRVDSYDRITGQCHLKEIRKDCLKFKGDKYKSQIQSHLFNFLIFILLPLPLAN